MTTNIELLNTTLLKDYPSGSAISYYNGVLYLVGDDANTILLLDVNYAAIDSIRLFNFTTKRIPKDQKPDLETAIVYMEHGKPVLLLLGSASMDTRKQALKLPIVDKLPDLNQLTKLSFYNDALLNEIRSIGIKELNIEGSTMMKDHFVISNRGNLSNPINELVFINNRFLLDQQQLHLFKTSLSLQSKGKDFAGISELNYVVSEDLLFITLSSEATSSAYADGAIGKSYLGIIKDLSKKMRQPAVSLDVLIDLAASHKAFTTQKIEGICVQAILHDHYLLHLVADDDQGHSRLFKIKLMK